MLILCMAAATAASLLSARFANRVDNRTVGRVTGVVLTVPGAALTLLVLYFTLDVSWVMFRKLLHLSAFCSAAVIVWRADSWQAASLTLVLFAAIVYPVLPTLYFL